MVNYEICPITTETEMDEKGYVHWKSWHETYKDLMPDDYLKSITLEKCIKMAHKFPQNTLLLKSDGNVVGFSCIGKNCDTENTNEIIAIYLLKEYQGKGLGYALMNKSLSMLPPNARIILWVLNDNEKAINFYKKVGFDFNGNKKLLSFGTELQMELKR